MLKSPRAPYLVIAVGILLALPSIAIGTFGDDHVLNATLDHRLPYPTPWWDLYRLIPVEAHDLDVTHGQLPWWAAPHLHLHLMRPLASALYALDHALFGAAPLGYHVHSLLWWAALLFVVNAGFVRILPRPTALLALAIFALSAVHVYPYGWASARHGLIASVLSLGGVVLYVRGRSGERAPRILAPVAFVLGLLASEAALGGLAFAAAYDLVGPGDHGRVKRAALPVGIALVYLAGYAALGAGARESGGYYAPFAVPAQFAAAAVVRTPVLIANALLGVPAEFANIGGASALAIVGVVAALVFAASFRTFAPRLDPGERAALPWLALGAVLALLASVGAYPGARLLELAMFGFAPLLATMIRHAFGRGPGAIVRRALGGLLVVMHLGLAPLITLANVASTIDIRTKTDGVARDARKALGDAKRAYVFGSDPFVTVYAPATLADEGGIDGCWAWIAGAKADLRITRAAPQSIMIEPIGTTLVRGSFETVYRDPSIAFHEGDEVTTCGARVRVLAVNGGLPSRVALDADFGAPDVVILAWQNGALARFAPPATNDSVVIPWSKGPSGFF